MTDNDIFNAKTVSPMLIGRQAPPFDDEDFIFELKLDGERCLAYLENGKTTFINKRKKLMNPHVPELCNIHKLKNNKCLLDGELIVLNNGTPDFDLIKNRSLTTNKYKLERMSSEFPATFTAFDILYYKDKEVTTLPLLDRKDLLNQAAGENERFAISRHIRGQGESLFNFTKQQCLEGIVAKRIDSIYRPGTRTKDWIKCKNLLDEDFVVCGYINKEDGGNTGSIILGHRGGKNLTYAGRVTLGLSRREFEIIKGIEHTECMLDIRHENAVYIEPILMCTVKFMEKTSKGGLRQPVFKGLV